MSKKPYLNSQTGELVKGIMEKGVTPFWQQHPLSIQTLRSGAPNPFSMKPEEVGSVKDHIIQSGMDKITVREYTPKTTSGSLLPPMLYAFSGGFAWGSVDSHDPITRALCNETGCKVFSVNYGLAPQKKYPVAKQNVRSTYHWVRNNSEVLGVDAGKMIACGYSAGGTLMADLAIYARNKKLPLAQQILICPWLDLACTNPSWKTYRDSIVCDLQGGEWFRNNYLPVGTNPKSPDVSPYYEPNLRGLAPALIIAAGYDSVVDEGKKYAGRLESAGVETTYKCYEGQIHQLLLFRGKLGKEPNPLDKIAEVVKDKFFSEGKTLGFE